MGVGDELVQGGMFAPTPLPPTAEKSLMAGLGGGPGSQSPHCPPALAPTLFSSRQPGTPANSTSHLPGQAPCRPQAHTALSESSPLPSALLHLKALASCPAPSLPETQPRRSGHSTGPGTPPCIACSRGWLQRTCACWAALPVHACQAAPDRLGTHSEQRRPTGTPWLAEDHKPVLEMNMATLRVTGPAPSGGRSLKTPPHGQAV